MGVLFMSFFRAFRDLFVKKEQAASHKKSWLRENAWMGIFLAATGGIYWHGICEKEDIFRDLQNRIGVVREEITLARLEKEELLRQLNSQSDPEWIELVLMKRLGLVPEGQTKVYFEKTVP